MKKKNDQIWHEQIKPLIEKRNEILDLHGNSFEAFNLPEIKRIDAEIDRLELMFDREEEYKDASST